MKFFNISDTAAFLKAVLSCSGDVYCRDENGNMQDLKQAARQLESCSWLATARFPEVIDVEVQKSADCLRLHCYMMEALCAK